jgi:hypothetical protein
MKNQFLTTAIAVFFFSVMGNSQVISPKASPLAKMEQKIGVTDIKIEYSRPSKSNRVVFGDVVEMNTVWRTGANDCTKFTCSDAVVFGKDTLKSGTYAIYTIPMKDAWEVIFYSDATNWGVPEKWDETKVALKVNAKVIALNDVVETFTISLDNLKSKGAELNFMWDKTRVALSFTVPTEAKVQASIDKVLGGPTASDYYAAADFYFKEKKDLKKALEWATKASELKVDTYWILRLKSQIEASLGNYKVAVETAKKALQAAEKANNKQQSTLIKTSIEEWSKK